jgi:hypothetical protein
MWIEITSTGTSTNRGEHRVKYEPVDLKTKTFQEEIWDVFWSYKHVLVQNGLKETKENPDILIEPQESEKSLGVRITVGGNRLLVSNLLNIAPNELTTTVVQKALALGRITLPTLIRNFVRPKDMVGDDLSAIIMGRPVHITPGWEIWTPPQTMVSWIDTWHKVKTAEIFNLILPKWLHGWLGSVSMNTAIDGWVLEGITWKWQKIRIRPNGNISIVVAKKEQVIAKEDEINLVIPDCLMGKIVFNWEPDHIPFCWHVWYAGNKNANEYICIEPGGVVKKMWKPGDWKKCSKEEVEKLWKYPTQAEIKKITLGQNQHITLQLIERLRALRNPTS